MLRITLSLTFLALGTAFSNTPHTGCNDAAPEVVQALTAEQGFDPGSCEDIAEVGACSILQRSAYSELCCASCASASGVPMRMTYNWLANFFG